VPGEPLTLPLSQVTENSPARVKYAGLLRQVGSGLNAVGIQRVSDVMYYGKFSGDYYDYLQIARAECEEGGSPRRYVQDAHREQEWWRWKLRPEGLERWRRPCTQHHYHRKENKRRFRLVLVTVGGGKRATASDGLMLTRPNRCRPPGILRSSCHLDRNRQVGTTPETESRHQEATQDGHELQKNIYE